ncbi:hypothetical protein HHI36_009797 [Cryptolaemus montrouzieri]|uniref:Reverse transcriptase n=1 Tax=Cryptolaemus montrouzieri TaxID=559131 RepID=A0ABD2MGZ8_9CUCU
MSYIKKIKDENGQILTTKAEIVNRFKKFYSKIEVNYAGKLKEPEDHSEEKFNLRESFFLTPTLPSKIEKIIEDLKVKKAPGIDGIRSKTLKEVEKEVSDQLSYIANECFMIGYFPESFKKEFSDIHFKIILLDGKEQESDEQDKYEKIHFETIANINKLLQASAPLTPPSPIIVNAPTTPQLPIVPEVQRSNTHLPDQFAKILRSICGMDVFSGFIPQFDPQRQRIKRLSKVTVFKIMPFAASAQHNRKFTNHRRKLYHRLVAFRKRYLNRRMIIQDHLQNIINLPVLSQIPMAISLRNMIDVINSNLNALNALSISTETWDPLLIVLLVEKLDPYSKRSGNPHLNHLPAIQRFLQFLERRSEVLLSFNNTYPNTNKQVKTAGPFENSKRNNNNPKTNNWACTATIANRPRNQILWLVPSAIRIRIEYLAALIF